MGEHDGERKRRSNPPSLLEYIGKLQAAMALQDWTIGVSEEVPDVDCNATIEPVCGRKLATISLAEDFDILSPEVQRHCIVHELIHCHLAQVTHLGELMSEPTCIWRSIIEYTTDGLADAIAPLLPLP